MKNLKNLGQALTNVEQKAINGGRKGDDVPTCSSCSNTYGVWLYTGMAGSPTGPGASCAYYANNGDRCDGTVSANGNSCCA